MSFRLTIVTFLALSAGANGMFQDGDSCGVKSSDFFKVDFGGDYRVAGPGCDLGNGNEDCLCGVNYDDSDRLSEWIWQCNGKVQFGPAGNKTCPATIPVPKSLDSGSVSNAAAIAPKVECDINLNPTGQRGDPVCSYSDCEQGGDTSSICGCVDLAKYGMGNGTQWFCMHSTCSCSNTTEMASSPKETNTTGTSGSSMVFKASSIAALLSSSVLLL
jgi:hypothetical protein